MKQVLVVADTKYTRTRIPHLVKYLPRYGWNPTVLDNPQTRYGNYRLASPKLRRIRPLLKRLYKPIKEIHEYPDKETHWVPPALENAEALCKTSDFNAVISSSAPTSSHAIAKQIKQHHNIPWIADLRDLWTQNIGYPYTRLRRWRERKLELETLSTANALVTVSQPWANKLATLHQKPCYSIPNSYDPDDYAAPMPPLTENLTITYTGQVYPQAELKTFRQGLLQFYIRNTRGALSPVPNMNIRFYGNTFFPNSSISSVIKQYGYVSHEEAVLRQRETQILLLLKWKTKDVGLYTGKIYEYLGAERPILAVGGQHDVLSELLETTNAGVDCLTPRDVALNLTYFYQEWKRNGIISYRGIPKELQKHTAVEMARKYADLLNEVTACKSVLSAWAQSD